MANHVDPVYEAGVFEDAVFTGVYTDIIDHLDLATKRIHLRAGVRQYHPVDDIYTEVRFIRRNDESIRVIDIPVQAYGNIPKGGGRFTSRYAMFNNGWRIVPADESHLLRVVGEQISDDQKSGAEIMDMSLLSPGVNVSVEYAPPDTEVIVITNSLSSIGSAVWDYSRQDATVVGSMGERLKNVSTVETTGAQIAAS